MFNKDKYPKITFFQVSDILWFTYCVWAIQDVSAMTMDSGHRMTVGMMGGESVIHEWRLFP